jgi:hypothetical protein
MNKKILFSFKKLNHIIISITVACFLMRKKEREQTNK